MKIIKQNAIVLILSLLLIVTSCSSKEDMITSNKKIINLSKLIDTESLVNDNMKRDLQKLQISLQLSSKLKDVTFNFENPTISSYEGTPVKSIIVHQKNINKDGSSYSFVTYSKDDVVWNRAILIKTNKIKENEYIVEYYTTNNELLGNFTAKNGIIIESNFNSIFDANNKSKVFSWWETWADCVGVVLDSFTDGTVSGALGGITCLAAGPECAAGVAIGCGIAADVEEYRDWLHNNDTNNP